LIQKTRQPVRDHRFYELTRSLCPECKRVVDAQTLIRDGAVYLRKHCPEHGWHEALVSSDSGWYVDSLKYNKPGAVPLDFATSTDSGCPYDCGLCPEHQQHTCLALIEITTRCNLACPTCFADAKAAASRSGYDLSLAQIESMLDRLLETEGQPEVLQLSGGEPTLHPQLVQILEAAQARDILYVMLNTNGLRLAGEPELVRELARYKPYIYLQFDGVTEGTHRTLRGRDLRTVKRQALDNLAEAGLYAVLVATVVQGVNDGEIGDILRYGMEHPAVLGVSYQPATYAGRYLDTQAPIQRATLPDVLHALEAQSDGLFRVSDFRPVPCPHPTCSASTYAYVDGDGAEGQRVIPIPRILEVDDYLDYMTNRTTPDLSRELQPVLEALWSMSAVIGSDALTGSLTCAACDVSVPLSLSNELSPENFFMIQVHGFMDEYNFDVARLMKCCVHQLLPDGRAVPFCAYNTLGYREEMEQAMIGGGIRDSVRSCP
jgi:uncharacterized radical SAM superfamily Fe-S cluster-containing enzyme